MLLALIAKDGAAVSSALSRQRAFWTIPHEIRKYFVQTCYVIKLTGVPDVCKIRALVSYRFSQSGNSYWVPLSARHSAVFNNIQHSALAPFLSRRGTTFQVSSRIKLASGLGTSSCSSWVQIFGRQFLFQCQHSQWQAIHIEKLQRRRKRLISITFTDQKNTMQTT